MRVGGVTIEQRFSQFTVTEGQGGDGDGTLEPSLLASWSSCWSPLSHHRLCCQPGVKVGRQSGNGHWLE